MTHTHLTQTLTRERLTAELWSLQQLSESNKTYANSGKTKQHIFAACMDVTVNEAVTYLHRLAGDEKQK